MEHRLGQRVAVDLPVRIVGTPGALGTGRLSDVSVSGAFIRTRLELPLLSLIEVTLTGATASADARNVLACVVRSGPGGIGIEWCDFAPQGLLAAALPLRSPIDPATLENRAGGA